MTVKNKILVDNFLKEIKKHLPEWIKNNDEKLEDVLFDISSHIWDSAQEIAGSNEPDPISIQKAINRLGTPKEIASSYKKRGTPKYFISEELWPIYSKVNAILAFIVLIIVITVQIVIVEPNNLSQALINGITISFPSISAFVLIVTLIFAGLSHEGYFPEDLGSKESDDPISKYYKPDEFLFSGLVGILFGFLIIIIPIDMINLFRIIVNFILDFLGYNTLAMSSEYIGISMELRIWLTLIGIVAIITGTINLSKISAKDPDFQFNMNLALILTYLGDFALALYILANLHLLSEVLPLSHNVLLFLGVLSIIGQIIEIISTVRKNINLYGLMEEAKIAAIQIR